MTSFESNWADRILGGRYKVETLLGRGGMSSVYRAHDPNLQRKVAVKVIHPHLTDNPEFVKRFEQEASSVAQLRHNNIVQVHDFNHDGDMYYMVLEYIPGESLAQKLRTLTSAGIHLPLNDTIRILSVVCDAVDYAHQRRMIHRDLKPANVMINLLGEPILMDFGIAKILGGQSHTASGAAMGTAAYMSPEQVRGEKTDHRADIYSLGIMLFEMLRGETPYHGDSTFQIMLKHVNEPIPDIRQLDANIPNSVAIILERALAKEPNERYQSAAEMAAALETVNLQLQGNIMDTLAGRHMDRLTTMWQQANDLFESRKLPEAIDKLDELKQVDPDYQQARINELRQKSLDQLYERAVRFYKDGKFGIALQTLSDFQRRSPDDPEADNLEKLIQHGLENQETLKKLEGLYDDALLLLESRDYEGAIAKWETIKRQKGELQFEDRLEIVKRAEEGICAIHYNEAFRAVTDGKPEEALFLLKQVHAINPEFADVQDVESLAQRQLLRLKQKQVGVQLGTIALIAFLFIAGFLFFQRSFDNGRSPLLPTPTTDPASLILTELPTQEANSVEKTAVPEATVASLTTAVATQTPTPTATATPTHTNSPTNTPTEEPAIDLNTAVVIQPASLFASPNADSEELAILQVEDEISVLGRSRFGNWFYAQNSEFVSGFVFGEFVEWDGDRNALPIYSSVTSPTATPRSGNAPLEFDLYHLTGTERCENGRWFVTLFFEGRGGSGVYSYYLDDALLASQRISSFTTEVASEGGAIITMGRVESSDGQAISRELFVTPPACGG